MASHEFRFEDVIDQKELGPSSGHYNDLSLNDDESCPRPPGQLPLPDVSLSFAGSDMACKAESPTHSDTTNGYHLGDDFDDTYAQYLTLPPSAVDSGDYPWSTPRTGNTGLRLLHPEQLCPRSNPELPNGDSPLSYGTPEMSSPSSNFSDGYYIHSPGPEGMSPPPMSLAMAEPLHELPIPGFNHGSAHVQNGLMFDTMSGPWKSEPADFNASTTPSTPDGSFYPSPSLNGLLGWPLQGQFTSDGFSSRLFTSSGPSFRGLNSSGPGISPRQIVQSNATSSPVVGPLTPSPGLGPQSSSAIWPHNDLLLAQQVPYPSPENNLASEAPGELDHESPAFEKLPSSPLSQDDVDLQYSDEGDYESELRQSALKMKYRNVAMRGQEARETALLEMRAAGISYKEIKAVGNFPDALPTLRGRHRVLTTHSKDRVRKPEWEPRDIQLLCEALEAESRKVHGSKSKNISWKAVAARLAQRNASYAFSYITCSQKFQELRGNTRGSKAASQVQNIRGRGAVRQRGRGSHEQ